jgi:hypothetical protein
MGKTQSEICLFEKKTEYIWKSRQGREDNIKIDNRGIGFEHFNWARIWSNDGDEHLHFMTTINIVISSCGTELRLNSVINLCYMLTFPDVEA